MIASFWSMRSMKRPSSAFSKNCYKGGQETNCRINQLILKCAESGWSINVHFIETADPADRFALESAYIAAFSPPWNRTR